VDSGATGTRGGNDGGGWLAVGRRGTAQQQLGPKTLTFDPTESVQLALVMGP